MSYDQNTKPQAIEAVAPTTYRRAIDKLRESLRLRHISGMKPRKAKGIRRRLSKIVAASVAQFRSEVRNSPAERRLANIKRRERRDDKVLASRNPAEFKARQERRAAAAGLVKPSFE